MSKIEVFIVVEGQTEQTFVRDVLAPYMSYKGIYLIASLVGTSGHKGGDFSFDRAKFNILNYLKQRGDTYISTMFDFFRIDSSFRNMPANHPEIKKRKSFPIAEKIENIESATLEAIMNSLPDIPEIKKRFIPYIEMHEFEALLFSDAKILAEKTGIDVTLINEILEKYENNPEAINTDPEKAPSKRLISLNKGYSKVIMGKTISAATGIPAIRQKCRHFNDWLTKLENLPMLKKVPSPK